MLRAALMKHTTILSQFITQIIHGIPVHGGESLNTMLG